MPTVNEALRPRENNEGADEASFSISSLFSRHFGRGKAVNLARRANDFDKPIQKGTGEKDAGSHSCKTITTIDLEGNHVGTRTSLVWDDAVAKREIRINIDWTSPERDDLYPHIDAQVVDKRREGVEMVLRSYDSDLPKAENTMAEYDVYLNADQIISGNRG